MDAVGAEAPVEAMAEAPVEAMAEAVDVELLTSQQQQAHVAPIQTI